MADNVIHVIKPSFSGGEFAPSLWARVDIQKYATGARKLLNFFVHPHGGISNRPGTHMVAAAKNNGEKIRVVDFQFASDENYVLEFGNGYVRFYTNDASLLKTDGTAWATTTTYTVGDIVNTNAIIYRCLINNTSGTFATDLAANKWEIDVNKWVTSTVYLLGDFVYSGSTITYCLQDHTSSTLTFAQDRAASTGRWIDQTIYEVPTPYSEADLPYLRFAQSADVLFIVHPDYAPRELARYHDTVWELTSYDFQNGPFMLPNDDTTKTMQVLSTSGNTTLVSSAAFFFPGHAGGQIELVHNIEGQSMSQSMTASTISASISCGGTWRLITHGSWVGKFRVEKQTQYATGSTSTWTCIRQFASGSTTSVADFNVDTYGSEDMSNGALPFLVRINYTLVSSGTLNVDLTTDPYQIKGVAEMNTYISTTQMSVTMQRITGSTITTSNWTEGAWSDYRGWPQTIVFAQDRLVFADNYNNPQTIWMSQTGNYYDFYINDPLVDSDGISINLPSQKLNEINGLTSLLKLLVFSTGAEWTVGGEATNSALTPTTINTRMSSMTGSSGVQPLVIVNRAIYVQARGCVIRDLGYDIFSDTFTGSNLSILANHLFFNHDIIEMAFQQDPDCLVWTVRDDGKLLSMTYMREQEVLAWTQHDTYGGDDKFESVCCIPATGYNQVWFSVNRDGQRYVERMDQRLYSALRKDQFFVDCGLTYDSSTILDIYTKLLLHSDTSSFTDEKSNTVTSYQVTLDTSVKKFGDGSAYFDGLTSYQSVTDSTAWGFGAGDFSVEKWVRFTRIGKDEFLIGQYEDDNNYWLMYKDASDKLGMGFNISGAMRGDYVMTNSYPFLINTWYYLMFVRKTTNAYIFVNGISQTLTNTVQFSTNNVGDVAATLSIGAIA